MTDKANITISLSVDLNRLGALISLLTKGESAVNVSVDAEPATELTGTEATVAIVDEAPVEEAVAEHPAEEAPVEEVPVEEAVAEQPAEEAPVEVDYYQLCEEIADKLRIMAKDGRRKEAKDIMSRYKVTALSKLSALAEDKIVELFNELQEY